MQTYKFEMTLKKLVFFFMARATEGSGDPNLDFGFCYHSRVRY